MAGRDVVAVGASAGGVDALIALVAGLPADLPAALLVVLHLPEQSLSQLATILDRRGPLPAAPAEDGAPLRPGRIYVARPNYHLLVQPGRVRVLAGPHENGLRPAIDPLFRSAAHAYGARAVGVVLSGTGDDGAAGLRILKGHGGAAVVQHPQDALFPGMPQSALAAVAADACLPAAEIPSHLELLARAPLLDTPQARAGGLSMTSFQAGAGGADETVDGSRSAKRENTASGFSCPECHGSLWEAEDGEQLWLECRVGHRYSVQSALAEQARTVEASVWAAINVLEERAALLRKQSRRAAERGLPSVARRCEAQAQDAEVHADAIRTSLLGLVQSLSADPTETTGDAPGGAEPATPSPAAGRP